MNLKSLKTIHYIESNPWLAMWEQCTYERLPFLTSVIQTKWRRYTLILQNHNPKRYPHLIIVNRILYSPSEVLWRTNDQGFFEVCYTCSVISSLSGFAVILFFLLLCRYLFISPVMRFIRNIFFLYSVFTLYQGFKFYWVVKHNYMLQQIRKAFFLWRKSLDK